MGRLVSIIIEGMMKVATVTDIIRSLRCFVEGPFHLESRPRWVRLFLYANKAPGSFEGFFSGLESHTTRSAWCLPWQSL